MSGGRKYQTQLKIKLRPQVEIVIQLEEGAKRQYDGLTLAGDEFALDTRDRLHFSAWLRRLDCPREQPIARGVFTKAEASGSDGELFEVHVQHAKNAPGRYQGWIRAKQVIYLTAQVATRIKLRLEGVIDTDGLRAGARAPPVPAPAEIELRTRPIYMKLAVMPSRYPESSDVYVFAGLGTHPSQRLRSARIKVEVEPPAGKRSVFLLSEEQNLEPSKIARWSLRYAGITWDDCPRAEFNVRAGLINADASVSQGLMKTIHIGLNMQNMLQKMQQYAGDPVLSANNPAVLNLNNPEYDLNTWAAWLWDWKWPDELRGLWYDARNFAGQVPATYTCGAIRDRIWDWLVARRFSKDLAVRESMNGIDFVKCEMAPLHVFVGFFPAGGNRDDPWFIDPWWRQHFDGGVMCSWNDEKLRLVAGLTFLMSPVLGVALVNVITARTIWMAIGLVKKYLRSLFEVGLATGISLPIVLYILGVPLRFRMGELPHGEEPYLKVSNNQYLEFQDGQLALEQWLIAAGETEVVSDLQPW